MSPLREGRDVLDPHAHDLTTEVGRLRHALAWALQSYEGTLAGKGTPAAHVISFGQSVLREGEA